MCVTISQLTGPSSEDSISGSIAGIEKLYISSVDVYRHNAIYISYLTQIYIYLKLALQNQMGRLEGKEGCLSAVTTGFQVPAPTAQCAGLGFGGSIPHTCEFDHNNHNGVP